MSRDTYRTFLIFLLSFFTICIVISLPSESAAQDVGDINFNELESEDLSDQQVQQLWQRAQDRGMSVSELQNMAEARGMDPAEVNKLSRRLDNMRSGQSQESQEEEEREREQEQEEGDGEEQQEEQTPEEGDGETTGGPSQIFGYNLFTAGELTFEPSLKIPTPQDYELGPDDEIIIDIWGASEQTYSRTISPDGNISINNVGPIYLNGLTIEEASKRLKQELSRIYSGLDPENPQQKDTYFQVSLGQVRTIQVTLLGEVRQPGTYNISSLSTVYNALHVSGGPNRQGSFRRIKVIRNNEVIENLDIYDFLVEGIQKNNIRLKDQDVVKIEPYINRVTLTGQTTRNGLFELKDGETLSDLFEYAGGFTSEAYLSKVTVRRNTPVQRKVLNVPFQNFSSFELNNGDRISVGQIYDMYANRVQIQGAVFYPGEYERHDTTSVLSLIDRADGLRGDAFTKRGIIYRTKPNMEIKTIPFNLDTLRQNPGKDIQLKSEDVVRITSMFDLQGQQQVQIKGAVNSAGTYNYLNNMTLEDLILQANGFSPSAAPYQIEIARRIMGDSLRSYQNRIADIYEFSIEDSLALHQREEKFDLKPYDIVYVRTSPAYESQKEVTIQGEVKYPGTYTMDTRNMRISDLIDQAGGLNPDAYPAGASLSRINRSALEGGQQVTSLPDSVLRNAAMGNRTNVGIELPRIIDNEEGNYDLFLRPGDVLNIPDEMQTVAVRGEVLQPVDIRFRDNLDLDEYIRNAGGFTERALENKAYVVYANGEVDRTSRFLFFKNSPDIEPGATIIVPRAERREELSAQERISIYSAIISMASIVASTIFQIRR